MPTRALRSTAASIFNCRMNNQSKLRRAFLSCSISPTRHRPNRSNHQPVTIRGTVVGATDSGGIMLVLKDCFLVQGPPGNSQPVVVTPAPVAPQPEKGPEVIHPRFSLDTGLAKAMAGLAFSSDGKYVVGQTPLENKNVQIWDLQSKQKLHEFDGPASSVVQVAVSPDGEIAAFLAENPRAIHLVEIVSGKELRQIKDHVGFNMTGLAFSLQGDLLVAASSQAIVGWYQNREVSDSLGNKILTSTD